MSEALAVVERPNGKLYRARKPPVVIGFDDEHQCEHWVAVLRTHDVDFARQQARPFVCNSIDIANPHLGWLRETIRDHERFLESNPDRGVPCVLFLEIDL